ncbi:MAG: hypothetical protein J5769_03420 [Bacteroidales bacterium]|nr:hypothetical protein [Bacteroidales bacterium]
MNANKKGYLAPECEEIRVRLESGFMGDSMNDSGAKAGTESYYEEEI